MLAEVVYTYDFQAPNLTSCLKPSHTISYFSGRDCET